MEWLLTSNTASARVLRTIIQGLLALIPTIVNVYAEYMPLWATAVMVPVIMCIISPIMAEIGKAIDNNGGAGANKIGGTE